MIQATSVNCSPIRPSFQGRNDDKAAKKIEREKFIAATTDLLDTMDENGFDETSFTKLDNLTAQMHDGPLKTFAKITALAGGAAAAGKIGLSKVITSATKNKAMQEYIILPMTKGLKHTLEKIENNAVNSKNYTKNNIKGFVAKSTKQMTDWIETYGNKGSTKVKDSIDTEIAQFKVKIADRIRNEALDANKTLDETTVSKMVEEKLSGKTKEAATYKTLLQRKELASTENLIKKAVGNVGAAAAGIGAVVEANRDEDKNGVPDIAQHNQTAEIFDED